MVSYVYADFEHSKNNLSNYKNIYKCIYKFKNFLLNKNIDIMVFF